MLLNSPFEMGATQFMAMIQATMEQQQSGGLVTLPAEFSERLKYYDDMERWYTGDALNQEVQDKTGTKYDLFPVHLNPLPTIISKHVEAVMGIASPGAMPVRPYVVGDMASSDEAQSVQAWLLSLLRGAGGVSALQDAVRRSEIYGGTLLRAIFRRDRVRWEHVHPRAFFVVPNSTWTAINELWIVKTISAEEAKRIYGVTLNDEFGFGIYVEHWTPRFIDVTIDGERALLNGKVPISNINPYGFVPAVYIPHMRGTRYWGTSLFEQALGLLRELNDRYRDIGQAINLDATDIIAMRNAPAPKVRNIAGRDLIDLGSSSGINASANPDMFIVGGGAKRISAPMMEYAQDIFEKILSVTDTPPIAFGKDEGSQRSSMTLEMRFWPLLAHANEERRVWSDALRTLSLMSVEMMRKHYPSHEISKADDDILDGIVWRWDEQLPRDIETLTRSAVERVNAGLGAPIDLLTLFPDVRNPAEAEENIREWMMFQASLKKASLGSEQSAGDRQDASQTNQE